MVSLASGLHSSQDGSGIGGQEQLTFFALAKRAGFELDWVPQSSLHPDFQADGAADDPAECRGLAGGVHVCVMRLAAAIH